MRLDLPPHPNHPTDVVRSVEVSVHRGTASQLVLTYRVIGDLWQIRLPSMQAGGRVDGLWQTTCFEAFIQSDAGDGYLEFNFSPSTQWAAYRFDDYRSGMSNLDLPRVSARGRAETGSYGLIATVDLDASAGLAFDHPWRMGFSAIIEEVSGRKSFWALAHPPGNPDFHHPVAFACDVSTVVSW
jgi:hypothetical protein